MPIYEYECQACGAVFERLQSFSAPAPESCEQCGKGPMQRLISRSGFVLKGGGFYTNEHPSASRRSGLKTEHVPSAPAPAAPKEKAKPASAQE